jgi:hypothetical protein
MIDVFNDPLFEGYIVALATETLPRRAAINELSRRYATFAPLMDKIRNSSTPQLLDTLQDSINAVRNDPPTSSPELKSAVNEVLKLVDDLKGTLKVHSAHDVQVQRDTDSIMEYALTRFYPLVQEAIAFPCPHRSQGNCSSCFNMKVKNYSRWMAEKGWELTKLHGYLKLSEQNRKLMG